MTTNTQRLALLSGLFSITLIFTAILRYSAWHPSPLSSFAGLATPLYIVGAIFFGVLFSRAGANFNRFGFGLPFKARHILLAVAGIALLQLSAPLLDQLWELFFDQGRDLSRFAAVKGSLTHLLVYVAVSWTIAAFGEEIAFRIMLMGSIKAALGERKSAAMIALLLQALVFGFIHIYQGPAGFAGTFVSGLILGAITLRAKGAIWPAAIAHGGSNTISLIYLYFGG